MPTSNDNAVSAPIKAICTRFGASRAWLYERMRDASDPFPQPVKLGARSVWIVHECDAWFSRRAAERGAVAAERGREIARAAGTASAAARRARRTAMA